MLSLMGIHLGFGNSLNICDVHVSTSNQMCDCFSDGMELLESIPACFITRLSVIFVCENEEKEIDSPLSVNVRFEN